MKIDNAYRLLGVSRSSTKDDIKKAFRGLAHIHHPDKGGDADKFKAVLEAYNVLMKHHVRAELSEERTYPYWKNGFVYYWPGDTGSYVGDDE